jgi:FixJ family two-component response regulator
LSHEICVHIVDSDHKRRAAIARQLYGRAIHAEIYEDLDELGSRSPSRGGVLINDDASAVECSADNDNIARSTGHLPVAFFSSNPATPRIVQAMRGGAVDYLEWPFTPQAINDNVARLAQLGEESTGVARRKAETLRRVERLTQREREVLSSLIEGNSNKQTAMKLGISPRTVEIHRANMMARLNARSTGDAVRIGLEAGIAG